MFKKTGRSVVDIGCGSRPFFVQMEEADAALKQVFATPISEEFLAFRPGDRYVGIDNDASAIRGDHRLLNNKKYATSGGGNLAFVVGSGTALEIKTGSADVVILSDVLSTPSPATDHEDELYSSAECIDDEDKWRMVGEALRILNDRGHLVIQIGQTPCYAKAVMSKLQKKLVKTGELKLVKQCGKFVPGSDNWHLYQAVFQKKGGPFAGSPEIIPWTEAQKKFIAEYTSSWEDCGC